MNDCEPQPLKIGPLVDALLASYESEPRTHHLDSEFLPNRDEVIEIIHELRDLLFPGFFSRQRLTGENVRYYVGEVLNSVAIKLGRQIFRSLRYRRADEPAQPNDHEAIEAKAATIVSLFLDRLPALRAVLATDVQAAYDGDPAAKSLDEIIFAYPGLVAVTTYRLAHELLALGVPLMPRIMTEWAHSVTGIDIHPGATIGQGFFIDHGTGVVIGETTEIGDDVLLYQGVVLGGTSLEKKKRHPTLGNKVLV
ncbi:MAG: serine acetyltransferase, partial [Phycisphaerae bacterium]|nr:serine acetyltransferase [Phycisphaerae bacterium]